MIDKKLICTQKNCNNLAMAIISVYYKQEKAPKEKVFCCIDHEKSLYSKLKLKYHSHDYTFHIIDVVG